MSARVYFIKRVKDCKMKLTLFVYCNYLVLLSTPLCSQNINKQIVNIADENLTDYSFFSVGITILNLRIISKDDIEFVTELLCLLRHPVRNQTNWMADK